MHSELNAYGQMLAVSEITENLPCSFVIILEIAAKFMYKSKKIYYFLLLNKLVIIQKRYIRNRLYKD
jgi:magnesium-transporting ATPase (P-type)